MRRWVVLLAVLIAACSQPAANPAAHVSASPAEIASPRPTASGLADLPLSTVGFACRLPVYSNAPAQDSFITFPSGTVTDDSNGNGGIYFDMAYSKWVPVGRGAVSPDGRSYAYIEMGDSGVFFVHLVSVESGKDVSFQESASASGLGAQPQIFDYAADGIYLTQAFEHIWAGVWLFQQTTASIHQVADIEVPEVKAGSGVIWYGAVNPADPHPFSSRSSAGIFPDEIDRLDLKTGERTQWLYRPGESVYVVGVDTSGRPLIQITVPGTDPNIASKDFIDHSQSELLLGLDPTAQRSIYKGQLVETLGNPIADSHGVWFGSTQGIYLFTVTGVLIKVSDHPGYPANGCF